MTAAEFSDQVLLMEPMLYRVAYGLLLNRTDCADAVQEALLRAWEKRRSLRDESLFRTWLVRILINECYTLLRGAQVHEKNLSPCPACLPNRQKTESVAASVDDAASHGVILSDEESASSAR